MAPERCEIQLDELPGLDQLVPTHCYAGWTLEVATDRSIDALHEVFDFASFGAVIEVPRRVGGMTRGMPLSLHRMRCAATAGNHASP